jgi:hypothetical protein
MCYLHPYILAENTEQWNSSRKKKKRQEIFYTKLLAMILEQDATRGKESMCLIISGVATTT